MTVEVVNEDRLRVFAGEILSNPAPLECSFNECTRCEYCFAARNGREKTGLVANATIGHIVNVFRNGGHPHSLRDRMLLARHPIVVSNAVDPLFPKNLASTRALLPVLRQLGVPVIFQTRGTDRPKDFPQYLDLLPEGSVLYCSLTTESEQALREAERGSPSHEERCEMIAMAAERGVPVIAALNPVDQDLLGDLGAFFDTIDRIVGKDGIFGTWIEPLHLSRRQHQAILDRHPRGLPVLLERAVERATRKPWVAVYEPAPDGKPYLDRYFFEDLFAAVDDRMWRRFSYALPWINKGRADIFEAWPRPFPTHHALVAACKEVSADHGGAPVAVTFETFCSWVDPSGEILDWEISRGDAWYFINGKQNAGDENRKTLPKTISLRECLRFVWNSPRMGLQAIYGAYGLKALTEWIPDEESEEGRRLEYAFLREDDATPLAVFAPQELLPSGEPRYTADPKDHFRILDEVEEGLVMLAPFEESIDEGDEERPG